MGREKLVGVMSLSYDTVIYEESGDYFFMFKSKTKIEKR